MNINTQTVQQAEEVGNGATMSKSDEAKKRLAGYAISPHAINAYAVLLDLAYIALDDGLSRENFDQFCDKAFQKANEVAGEVPTIDTDGDDEEEELIEAVKEMLGADADTERDEVGLN